MPCFPAPRFSSNWFEAGSQEAKNSNFLSLALAATGSVDLIRVIREIRG